MRDQDSAAEFYGSKHENVDVQNPFHSDEHWGALGKGSLSKEFLRAWLSIMSNHLGNVSSATILLGDGNGSFTANAIWPSKQTEVKHLKRAAEIVASLGEGRVFVSDQDGIVLKSGHSHIAYPVVIGSVVRAISVIDVKTTDTLFLQTALRKVNWAISRLEAAFLYDSLDCERAAVNRMARAIRLIAAGSASKDPRAAALAFVNRLAEQTSSARVSIGMLTGRRIRLWVMSNTPGLARGTPFIRAIEGAMEVAVDRAETIVCSTDSPSDLSLDFAHKTLVKYGGFPGAFTTPITDGDRIIGAMTFEFESPSIDRTIVQTAELVAALCGPELELRRRLGSPIAGRIPDATLVVLRRLLGPRNLGAKFTMALAIIALALPNIIVVPFRVSADAVVEGRIQRAVVAPFAGYILQSNVRAGEPVYEGQLLAKLDDRDLLLEYTQHETHLSVARQEYHIAQAEGDRVKMGMSLAEQKRASAELELVSSKLARTEIRAPIAGEVIQGDLSERLGAPVDIGETLFEISPSGEHRLILYVDQLDIGYLKEGQNGYVVLDGLMNDRLAFSITHMSSVAQLHRDANRFRVEATPTHELVSLRPGLEGVAKVEISKRSLLWVWTRKLSDSLTLALWRFLP